MLAGLGYYEIGKWTVCSDISCKAKPDANINPNVAIEPFSWLMEYKHSNEACCEALVHVICDPAKKTCKELSAWPSGWAVDMGAHTKVAVVPKPSDGYWFFTGYGMNGGICNLKGYIYDVGTGSYVCLCDGASDCNLTSNVGQLLYYPARDYLIAGGHCGGRWVWVLQRSGLKIVGRFSESRLRTFDAGGNIYLHPVSGSTDVVVTIGRTYSKGQYFRVGVFDLEEAIKYLANMPSVDELSSWKEIYKTTKYYTECVPNWTVIPRGGTSFSVAACIRTSSGTQSVVVGPLDTRSSTTPKAKVLNCANPIAIAPNRFACINGRTVYVYDADGNQVGSVTVPNDINGNHFGFAWPFVTVFNSGTGEVKIYAVTVNDVAAVPVVDDNGNIRIFDLKANDYHDDYVYYIGSPLAVGMSRVGTLPIGDYSTAKTPLSPSTSNDVDKVVVFVPKLWEVS